MEDWEAYLTGKGVRGRHATGSELAYPCFFDCNEPPDSKKRKLYVNGESGLYSCKVCLSEGNGTTLMRHFGDEPEHAEKPSRKLEVLEAATAMGEKMLAANDDVIFYLLGPKRGLSPDAISKRRFGYVPPRWSLSKSLPGDFTRADLVAGHMIYEESGQDIFTDRILIPYIENGRVLQVRGKDIHGRYYTAPNDAVRLYNTDSLKGASEAVIVEGEFDACVLAELLENADDRLRNMAVIGIAGVNAIPDDFDQRLVSLRRIYIGTDPDTAGRLAAEKLRERIGQRAVVPEWPGWLLEKAEADGLELKDLDWSTWVAKYGATWEAVAPMLRPVTSLVSLEQAGERWRNRPTTGIRTGFSSLDKAIDPGLLTGQLLVILAKTGVGKTLVLCNLAYNMRDINVLFVTLEMTAEEIYTRLARVYRFHHPWASDDDVDRAFHRLRISDANRLSESDFARLVDEYTEDVGAKPDVVFIDYLGYYARGRRGGTSYEKTSDAVMQLKSEAKKHELGVVVPAQVNRGAKEGKPIDSDDARDSGVIEETADFLLALWRQDDALDYAHPGMPSWKLHLKILKSRHGNKDKTFLLQMAPMSLAIVDDGSLGSVLAKKECEAAWRGETYERWLIQRQSTPVDLRGDLA